MAIFLPRNFRAFIKNNIGSSSDETITDVITCDASLSEDHVFRNTVTKYPVEYGSKISDHATIEPDTLEMILLFSDTPTSNFDLTEQLNSKEGRSVDLFKKVKEIRDKKLIVTVITGLIPHQSMMIEELSVGRRSGDGKKVECRCVFTKVPIVTRDGIVTQGEETPVAPTVNHTAIATIALGVIAAGTGIGAVIGDLF